MPQGVGVRLPLGAPFILTGEYLMHQYVNVAEADHITPWHEGGKTTPENCQMLCKHDNRVKSGK